MWREIVSFNGSVFILNVDINKWLNLYLSCFEYEVHSSNFIATTHTRQQFKSLPCSRDRRSESRLSCLGFKVLLDHHRGIFLPFFVAQVNDDLCYLFCLDSPKDKWVVRYSFEVPKHLGLSVRLTQGDYSIANGPTIIWIAGNQVFIYKGEWSFEKTTGALLMLSVSDIVENVKLDVQISGKILWWDDGLYPGACEYGLMVFKPDKLPAVVSTYLITLDKQKKTASITSTLFVIPPLYLSIATCSCIFSQSSSVTKGHSAKVPYRVFISTTQSQLVEFFEGQYIKHVNIPLSDCKTVEVFENPAGEFILLCCQEDKICAVDWKSSEILKTWSNVNNLLKDDFVGTGSNQILLSSGNSKEQKKMFEDFILTDLLQDELIRTKGQEQGSSVESVRNPHISESKENSMDKVLNALNKKVKATEESIIERKMEKSEKSSFVKKHCNVLHDILITRKPICSFQTLSLANLLIGCETSNDEGGNFDCSKLVVTAEWQDLCHRQWVVGLEIENVGENAISDISVCLVNKNRSILPSYSKICMTEERQKRQQHSHMSTLACGQKLSLTTSTGIPDYTCQPRFCVGLMLSWKQGADGYHFAKFCGEIILSVHDIINYEARKPIFQSHVCSHLALSNLETQVIISSRNTNSSPAIELLKSKMDVCQCCSIVQPGEKYRPGSSFLREVHVSFANIKNVTLVTIFSRNLSQLCITLYMLQQNMPDDVIWRPLRSRKLIDDAMKCAEDELVLTIKKLTNLLKVHSRKNIAGENAEMPDENIREEISVKRRKLSQLKQSVERGYNGSADFNECLKAFSEIGSCRFGTERIFESFLLWETSE